MNNTTPSKGLEGQGVLVTRQMQQAHHMAELIRENGGTPYFFPVIETVPVKKTEEVKALLNRLETFHWLVFTSTNGVEHFFQFYNAFNLSFDKFNTIKVVAVGTTTAKKIEDYDVKVELVPDVYIAEHVVKAMESRLKPGEKVLLPKADIGRDIIANDLRNAGLDVTECVLYHTRPVQGKREELLALLRTDIDIITFTSSSTVHNFMLILGKSNIEMLLNKHIACIGPKTAQTAKDYGLKVSSTAEVYTVEGMIQKISRR